MGVDQMRPRVQQKSMVTSQARLNRRQNPEQLEQQQVSTYNCSVMIGNCAEALGCPNFAEQTSWKANGHAKASGQDAAATRRRAAKAASAAARSAKEPCQRQGQGNSQVVVLCTKPLLALLSRGWSIPHACTRSKIALSYFSAKHIPA